jgi:hypothetical protein
MLIGYVDRIDQNVVAGWAADSDLPESIISVVIYVGGKRVATIPCDRDRSDLGVLPDLRGFVRHGFRFEFSSPLNFDLIGQVSVRFSKTGEILPRGQIKGQHFPSISPILVSAPARSGTTFMMNRLSHSSKICIVEVPPFEVRLLAYWASVYRTLTAEPDFNRSTHPDSPEGDGYRIGSNPYSHEVYANGFSEKKLITNYFSKFVPEITSEFIRQIIDEYYLRLRDYQEKNDALYFAEKCNSLYRPTRINSRIFYPELKEIIIIRDPRDILCSHVAFFNRSREHAFNEISDHCRELLRIHRSVTQQEIFVKYEDMIVDDPATFRKLSEFLSIPNLLANPEREGAMFKVHATSKSPTDSIGRWKELPPDDIRRCNAAWAEFLDEFGYEH